MKIVYALLSVLLVLLGNKLEERWATGADVTCKAGHEEATRLDNVFEVFEEEDDIDSDDILNEDIISMLNDDCDGDTEFLLHPGDGIPEPAPDDGDDEVGDGVWEDESKVDADCDEQIKLRA